MKISIDTRHPVVPSSVENYPTKNTSLNATTEQGHPQADVYKRQLFEFAAVIVYHRKILHLIKKTLQVNYPFL